MTSNTCPVCGLPNELCVCSEVEKTSSLVEIKIEKRKYGKFWAVVSGVNGDTSDLKTILKTIKNKMACAGTVKGKNIEVLYGRQDRSEDLIKVLGELGFDKDSIHVTQ
ncbi:MAG: stress response translation initiation inhibitor YciH [Nanoarchaeota archaeon]|nr:stress response translation initiation inhibitor YciH [Nanoarchaeota archaeon]